MQKGDLWGGDRVMLAPKILQLIVIISAIVCLIAIIGLIVIYSSQPAHKPSQQETSAEKPNKEQATKECETFWQRIISDPVAFITLFLAFATFLLAFSAFIQLNLMKRAEHIAKNTADAAKKSAEVAEKTLIATQRPWLSVNMKIGSDFKITEQKATITIKFIVKNVGISPAFNIFINANIHIMDQKRDPLAEQQKVCRKRQPADNLGYILFPNEHFIQDVTLSITREEIEQHYRNVKEQMGPNKDKLPPINIININSAVVGCISYRFAVDESFHKTSFAATIESSSGIRITSGDIPANMLSLEPFIYGNFAD